MNLLLSRIRGIYSAKKIEEAVCLLVRDYFRSMKNCMDEAWEEHTRKRLRKSSTERTKQAQDKLKELQKRQELLKQEVVKSLSGQSAFSAEMLRSMIDETQAAIAGAEEELRACEGESASETEQMKQLRAKFQEISDWADAFEHLHGDARKMILSRIIERITVDRDYNLTITFYITREEFEGKYADHDTLHISQALAAPSLRFATT